MTPEEQKLLVERRKRFNRILAEQSPVLHEFAEVLELPNPPMILVEPDDYVAPIAQFMRDQTVEEDDRVWIITRLGYFIGEVLCKRLGGCWFLNDWPGTRYFLRIVVGRFGAGTRPNVMADPFEAASEFVAHPPGRDLGKYIDEIEAGCRV
jgi:hypothetical protein